MVSFLRGAGIDVTTSRELGLNNTPDVIWIPQVASLDYVIVTADARLRLVPAEKEAMIAARARVVVGRVGGSSGLERVARNLVNSHTALERFVDRETAPWFVSLSLPNDKDFDLRRPGRISKNKL